MIRLLSDKKIQKYIYIGMTVLILPGFLLFGVAYVTEKNKENSGSSLAIYNNKKITVQDYLNSYRAVDRQINMQFGERASAIRSRLNLKGEAWDRILLLGYAKKNGISVSDSEVVQWLMSQPAFFSRNQFDENLYKMYVKQYLRMEPRSFEEELRDSLALDKVRRVVVEKASLSDEELRRRFDAENPNFEIAYGVIPWEKEKPAVRLDEEEVNRLYETVKDNLTAPLPDGKGEKKLTPDEAKAEVRNMLLKQQASDAALKKLQDLKDSLAKANVEFEKALTQAGVENIQIQTYSYGQTLPLITDTDALVLSVKDLKENEISEPFFCGTGAAIAKLIKKTPATDDQFQKSKEAYRAQALTQKQSEEMKNLLERLRGELKLNLELMKKIFPEDELTTPASPAAPSVPS